MGDPSDPSMSSTSSQTRSPLLPAPPGTAVLVWSSPGGELPAQNLDPRACAVAGARNGALYSNGQQVNLAFTTKGGLPRIGQTVWLASAQDDAETGAGKATATKPSTHTPYTGYPLLFPQNIVAVGVCTDNSRYSVDGTAVVLLGGLPGGPSGNTPPADQEFSGSELTTLSASNYVEGDGNAAQLNMKAGQTLVAVFSNEMLTAFTGSNILLANTNFTAGWRLGFLGGVLAFEYESGAGGAPVMLGVPQAGLNCLVLTVAADGRSLRATLNGGTTLVQPQTPANIPVVASGWKFLVGGGYPGSNGWEPGGLFAAAMLNRAVADADAASWSAPWAAAGPGGPRPVNRVALPAQAASDSQLLWQLAGSQWDGSSSTFNTIAGPAGAGFTLTRHGAPTKVTITDTWRRGLAPFYLDTDRPLYDSRGYPKASAGHRIAFTVPTAFDVWRLTVGYERDDFDDNDNADFACFVNGILMDAPVFAGGIGARPDGAVNYYTTLIDHALPGHGLPGGPPYLVEIVAPDRVSRNATYESGSALTDLVLPSNAVFQTSDTGRRLLIIGDGQVLGGHDQQMVAGSPASGAVYQQLRASYPGRITADVPASQSVASILFWGNGSMAPHAAFAAAQWLTEGNPTVKEILVVLGMWDWEQGTLDPTAFGRHLGAYLDALHAADSTATIFLAPPPQTNLYATPSPAGSDYTLQEYRDAVTALATGRSWLALRDISGPNNVDWTPNAGMPAFLPTAGPTGQGQLASNIRAALGF